MIRTIPSNTRQWLAAIALIAVAAAALTLSRGQAVAPVAIYDAFPNGVPGNVPSVGFEATSTTEFGDHISFIAGDERELHSATVMMSSWGCESGSWYANNCVTTPGSTFNHSITLKLYNVVYDAGTPTAGYVLATKTQTFAIPFRPSADPACSGTNAGKWYSASETSCFNGFATPITFTFAGETLPEDVIWGVSYSTTHYGSPPMGEAEACYTGPGGCGYDSLNVGVWSFLPIVGTDVAEEAAFANSTWSGFYCDGGTLGTGTFRYDSSTGCWTGYRPLIRINATEPLVAPPTAVSQCKNDGWKAFNNPPFKNQGDCVSYVNNSN